MATLNRIIDDKRPISSVWGNEGQTERNVGMMGVTKIESYHENGEMAPVVWLRVWKGDVLVARLNAAHIAEITYQV